jgi:hypothetical protein
MINISNIASGKLTFEVLLRVYWRDILKKGHQAAVMLTYNPSDGSFIPEYPICK